MQKDKISRSLNENQKYIKNVLGDTNSIYTFSDIGMVIMALGMVYQMVSKKKGLKTITVAAMIVGAISVLIWTFFEVGVLGADVMKQFVVVCMQQVKSAQLTNQLGKDHNKYINFLAFPWSQISIGLSIGQPLLLFVGLLVRKILSKNIANTKGRQ